MDEHQHEGYSCENKRICELSEDVGHRPITIVRFNPDAYNKADGTRITSCWGTNRFGLCVVKPSKKKEWEERLYALKERMLFWMNNPTMKMIHVEQLFYDEVQEDEQESGEDESTNEYEEEEESN